MGCGCKKRKAQQVTTQNTQNVKESVKVVINKYNKVKK